MEEFKHPVLGHRFHFRFDARGGREAVPGHRHQGPAGVVRAEKGQRQQGDHRLQHHVHRGPVSEVPPGTLEVPQDSSQQVVRVYARDARGRSGHGV